MVLAGMEHPDYDEFNRHLDRIAHLRFGDLVEIDEGYQALVVDPMPGTLPDGQIAVALGNGLEVLLDWTQIRRVFTLPESEAHVNFQEWVHQRT